MAMAMIPIAIETETLSYANDISSLKQVIKIK